MTNLDVATFSEKITNSDMVLIDVRTSEEFSEAHIFGATNIDIYSENFISQIADLDKSKSYAIYCRSGKRSEAVCQIMSDLGFKFTYNLIGGIIKWIEARKEVIS
jgi:rhodanese-related sulfurtransferase